MKKNVSERYKCSKNHIIMMKGSYVINNIYQTIRKVSSFLQPPRHHVLIFTDLDKLWRVY